MTIEKIQIPDHIKGLVFDCDGTVADTMPLHYRAWLIALGEHDVDFSEALFYELAGVSTPDIIRLLNDRHGYSMPVDETAAKKDLFYEEMIPEVLPISPVVDVVLRYRDKLPMAVATGGSQIVVRKTLQSLGLLEYFKAVVSADDVSNGKPAPDIFLEAARRIGIAPELCCGLEDAELGLASVRAAGMLAIDIRPYYRRPLSRF